MLNIGDTSFEYPHLLSYNADNCVLLAIQKHSLVSIQPVKRRGDRIDGCYVSIIIIGDFLKKYYLCGRKVNVIV